MVTTIAAMDRGAVEKYFGKYQLGTEPATWLGMGLSPLGLTPGQVTDHRVLSAMLGGGRVTAEVIAGAQREGRSLDLDHLPRLPVKPQIHRAGFDLCFSAPKSISVLAAALPDGPQRNAMIAAHDAAVVSAFAHFEKESGRIRVSSVPVPAGLIGAGFRHWTSRAGDPQLHTHVLLVNAGVADPVVHAGQNEQAPLHEEAPEEEVEFSDELGHPGMVGTDVVAQAQGPLESNLSEEPLIRAVDARGLFTLNRSVGAIYRSQLRANLAGLGLTFALVNGTWEVSGLGELVGPKGEPLVKTFSRRSTQIEEARLKWANDHGHEPGGKSRSTISVTTRGKKLDAEADNKKMRGDARALLSQRFGVGASDLVALFDNGGQGQPGSGVGDGGPSPTRPRVPSLFEQVKHPDQRTGIVHALLGEVGEPVIAVGARAVAPTLASKAFFTRQDLVGALCEIAPLGADAEDVSLAADYLLGKVFVPLVPAINAPDGSPPLGSVTTSQVRHPLLRYAVKETITEEREVLTLAREVTATGALAGSTIDHTGLSNEQAGAVAWATSGDTRVRLIAGGPGAGKTTLLSAAARAWKKEGCVVWGLSHQGQRADELAGIKGISEGKTIDSFLLSKGNQKMLANLRQNGKKIVFVVDEAAALDRKRLLSVLQRAHDLDARVVLIGDDRQQSSIEAGGMFPVLLSSLGGARLVANHRQLLDHERNAIALARAGYGHQAAAWLRDGGRIEVMAEEHTMVSRATEIVVSSLAQGLSGVAITKTKAQALAVNRSVHAAMVAEGTVTGVATAKGDKARSGKGHKNQLFDALNDDSVSGKKMAIGAEGVEIGIGDRVMFTKNITLGGSEKTITVGGEQKRIPVGGEQVRNGTFATVIAINADGSLVVNDAKDDLDDAGRLLTVDRETVSAHVTLGYASTAAKAQGRSIDGNVVVLGADAMDSGDLLVSISRARLKTSVLLQADQRDDGSLDAAGAVKRLARSLTALSAPESAVEWLMDEAEAAKLARTLGTVNCMRLAAMWDGGIDIEALHLGTDERRELEAVADNEQAGEEARGAAHGRLEIHRVLEVQERRIKQSVGGGHQIDRAFMERQGTIAERAAELASAGVLYTGAAVVPLELSEDIGGIEMPAMPVAHVPGGSAPAIIERVSSDIGGRIAGMADRDHISLIEAASRYCAEHNLAAGWAVHLTVAGECARVSMMAATAPPAATSGTSDGEIEDGVADAVTEEERRARWVAETAARIAHEVVTGGPSIDGEEIEEEAAEWEVVEEAESEVLALDPLEALWGAFDRAAVVAEETVGAEEVDVMAKQETIDEARREEEGKAEARTWALDMTRRWELEESEQPPEDERGVADAIQKALDRDQRKKEEKAKTKAEARTWALDMTRRWELEESPDEEWLYEEQTARQPESQDDELSEDLGPVPSIQPEIEEDRHIEAPALAPPQVAPPAPAPAQAAPPAPAPSPAQAAPPAPAPRWYSPEPPEPGQGMRM